MRTLTAMLGFLFFGAIGCNALCKGISLPGFNLYTHKFVGIKDLRLSSAAILLKINYQQR
jgi:hypothetical protein